MSELNELEKTLVLAAAEADSGHQEPVEPAETKPEFYKNLTQPERTTSSPEPDTPSNPNPKKRTRDSLEDSPPAKCPSTYSNVIANHYNQLEEKGIQERFKSRIVYLRNFHNWIKSMLINEYLSKIKTNKKQYNAAIRVHDMCCGKGGDLSKWKKGGITHLICSDIASVSLEQCRARYEDIRNHSRDRQPLFTTEFIEGDCTRVRLREKYSDPSIGLDLVSCQFSFHYSFESLPQLECILRNAAECLQPGGYFIGTIPDAYELVARARKHGSQTYGNDVYEVSIDFDVHKPPLFGAKYNFQLDGVVNNCPEFLVYFPVLVKLAKKYGLRLVRADKFQDYFERMKEEGMHLLRNMRSLEGFPPPESCRLNGSEEDYEHAKEYVGKDSRRNVLVGTLSKSEWEVSSIYKTFAFEKMKRVSMKEDGTPIFEI
ncbi:unnamed protein product [Phyllotreta striolata]|uniref:mRNA cap guanine-N(7) methyltransferase n=1 Tax=Phyllotreta striolata TaxID=444603 RepID=A0A9N9XRF2_PHYSR|nr:unnamed protein product [Phyllotreta striolata]